MTRTRPSVLATRNAANGIRHSSYIYVASAFAKAIVNHVYVFLCRASGVVNYYPENGRLCIVAHFGNANAVSACGQYFISPPANCRDAIAYCVGEEYRCSIAASVYIFIRNSVAPCASYAMP